MGNPGAEFSGAASGEQKRGRVAVVISSFADFFSRLGSGNTSNTALAYRPFNPEHYQPEDHVEQRR